jgi:hypothetical protein
LLRPFLSLLLSSMKCSALQPARITAPCWTAWASQRLSPVGHPRN